MNRRVMERILERAGHAVVLVGDGEEALDALEAGGFDAALMDLNMPVLDGIEATKLHRFAALGRPHVPIIGLTADASPEAARRCLEAGMDACLTKPIGPARLIEAIEAFAGPASEGSAPGGAGAAAEQDGGVAHIASHPRFRRPPAGAPIDPQVTAGLEALGGTAFAAELAHDFVEDGRRALGALAAALREGDVVRFRSEAHALRSSAANIGATGVRALCSAAEAVPGPELAANGGRHLALLAAELDRVSGALPDRPGGGGGGLPERSSRAR